MKRITAVITILLTFGMLLSGCSVANQKPTDESLDVIGDSSRMKVYVSFYPMYYLASEIAGDKASVVSMVPAGAEPHDWEPTPKLAVELNKADLLIYNGAGMETWMENILTILDNNKIKVIDASKGIELLEAEEHEESEESVEENHEHGEHDPHIWVSPIKLKQQAQTVYEAILEADPENTEYYKGNMTELTAKLDKLDKDIRDAAKLFKSNLIVVSHEAFGYFAHDYGFRQLAIRGVNPQDEPSPSKMAELVGICKDNNVKYIFFEKLTSPKLSETLAKEVGAEILVLNDAAGLSEEDINSGKDYVTVMYDNLENLKKALGD